MVLGGTDVEQTILSAKSTIEKSPFQTIDFLIQK